MNNPLAQKAQYYLNESHRLSEELKSEEAYSELLENVLFELLGEEDFTKLFEYVMQGTITHDADDKPLNAARSARRANRLKQIRSIGQAASLAGDNDLVKRVAHSIVAKGGNAVRKPGVNTPPGATDNEYRHINVTSAIKDQSPMFTTTGFSNSEKETEVRATSDDIQKRLSANRRSEIKYKKDRERNTF